MRRLCALTEMTNRTFALGWSLANLIMLHNIRILGYSIMPNLSSASLSQEQLPTRESKSMSLSSGSNAHKSVLWAWYIVNMKPTDRSNLLSISFTSRKIWPHGQKSLVQTPAILSWSYQDQPIKH